VEVTPLIALRTLASLFRCVCRNQTESVMCSNSGLTHVPELRAKFAMIVQTCEFCSVQTSNSSRFSTQFLLCSLIRKLKRLHM
jgi:hypothetical protein